MKRFESFLATRMEQYLEYRKANGYQAKTPLSHLKNFDRYLQDKKTDEEMLQPSFFLEMRTNLAVEARSVNRIIASVRVFFKYLVRQGHYQRNPLQDIPYLRENAIIPFVFSPEEVEQLLIVLWKKIRTKEQYFMKDFSDYLVILLLARCGLRISEPLRMLVRHYNPIEKTIYIEKTKFKKDRLIPVPQPVAIEIRNYISVRNALLPPDNRNPFLFISDYKRGVSGERIRRIFRHTVKEIGLARSRQIFGSTNFNAPTPHSLRHSFAVNTLKGIKKRGDSPQNALPVLAIYMGHTMYRHTVKYLKVLDAAQHRNLTNFAAAHAEQT
jgi:integrase/recombinase XerD